MSDAKHKPLDRRGFLKSLGAGATVAAAAPLAVGTAQAMPVSQEEGRARYQETEHVKTFYRVNGYED